MQPQSEIINESNRCNRDCSCVLLFVMQLQGHAIYVNNSCKGIHHDFIIYENNELTIDTKNYTSFPFNVKEVYPQIYVSQPCICIYLQSRNYIISHTCPVCNINPYSTCKLVIDHVNLV